MNAIAKCSQVAAFLFVFVLGCQLQAQVSFNLASSPTVGSDPNVVTTADLYGDGRLEVICANSGGTTLSILTNNGSGVLTVASSPSLGNHPQSVTAADLKGNGKLELICSMAGNTLLILTNNGSGSFTVASTLIVGNSPYSVVAADVNGDGKLDLICANYAGGGGNTLSVLTNNGTGGFVLSSSPTVGFGPAAVTAADVNGDGKLDLISANYGTQNGNTLSVLTNNGSGGFVLSSTPTVGTGPASITAADVNGDGKLDLICANLWSSTLSVLTNNGSGGFVLSSSPIVGTRPNSAIAADINGDGKLDLICVNALDDSVSILTNNGTGGFATAFTPVVDNYPNSVTAADLNGDGKLDLVCANYVAGTLSVLTNATPFPPQSFLNRGLVAYYPFAGNANDAIGTNNGVSYGATLTTNRFGVPNSAYFFNGSNSYIQTLYPMRDLTTATFSLWFNASAVNARDVLLSDSDTAVGNDCNIQFWDTNLIGVVASKQGAGAGLAITNGVGNFSQNIAGNWLHFVWVMQPANQQLYVDGVLITNASATANDVGFHGSGFVIGANSSDSPYDGFFNGAISDVRVYNVALASNQVALLYALESSPFSITNQPATVTNNLGDNVVLSIGLSGVNPSDFQWYFNGITVDNGSNATLNIANISQPYFGNYYVVVTNALSSLTSSIATIYEPATVISQPSNVVVPLAAPAAFGVSAVGYPAPNYYQWSLNGTNISGANTNQLSIPSVKLADTGNYQVLVSNGITSTNSSVATLDVSPSITSPFVGATPIWGRSTTLSVGVVGNGTLTYQWYFNGQPITNAVYPQLDFASIQLTNSGFYSVVITSPYGSITNAAYQVAVSPAVVTLGFYPGLTINGAAGNNYLIQRSSDLSNTNNWKTLSSFTLSQPVQLWIDTSVDASSPFNNLYFYQLVPQ